MKQVAYSIDVEDFVATVDASRTVFDFDQELAEYGLVSSLHAPKSMTISEALAQDWGHNSRQVLGLYLEHYDGTQSKTGGKVIKNVSGYDLSKLYLGSCNQLAKIVAASLRLELLPKFQAEIAVPVVDLNQAVLIAYDLSTRDFDDTCTPVIRDGEIKFKLAAVKEELLELKVKRLVGRLGGPDLSSVLLSPPGVRIPLLPYTKHYPKSDTRVELHAALTELAGIAEQLKRPCMILPKQGHILLDGCAEDIQVEGALTYKYPLELNQEQINEEQKLLKRLQEDYRGQTCAN
jgi:hypothetical protein